MLRIYSFTFLVKLPLHIWTFQNRCFRISFLSYIWIFEIDYLWGLSWWARSDSLFNWNCGSCRNHLWLNKFSKSFLLQIPIALLWPYKIVQKGFWQNCLNTLFCFYNLWFYSILSTLWWLNWLFTQSSRNLATFFWVISWFNNWFLNNWFFHAINLFNNWRCLQIYLINFNVCLILIRINCFLLIVFLICLIIESPSC